MKIVGLLLVLISFLVPVSVYAAGFGLSPYIVDTEIEQGKPINLPFTVKGFNGILDISAENLPVEITPQSMIVSDGSNIVVTLICNLATENEYNGKLVFLAKGEGVQSGIKVPCHLTIKGLSSTQTEQTDNNLLKFAGILVGIILMAVFVWWKFMRSD